MSIAADPASGGANDAASGSPGGSHVYEHRPRTRHVVLASTVVLVIIAATLLVVADAARAPNVEFTAGDALAAGNSGVSQRADDGANRADDGSHPADAAGDDAAATAAPTSRTDDRSLHLRRRPSLLPAGP